MATRIVMPEMGEGVIEGTVARWLKAEGDSIEEFEPLLEIETDKVTTEATAEEAGTLLKIYVEEGETVPVGSLLAYVGEPGERLPDGDGEAEAPEAEATPDEELVATGAQDAAAPHDNGGRAAQQASDEE